eukprot:s1212_g9.t1
MQKFCSGMFTNGMFADAFSWLSGLQREACSCPAHASWWHVSTACLQMLLPGCQVFSGKRVAVLLTLDGLQREACSCTAHVPQMPFAEIRTVVIRGALERLETYLRNTNQTVQDWWRETKKDEMYGEYSYESYTKMQMTEFLSGMEPFDPSEPGCSCCDVTQRGGEGLDAIADALRLKRQAVDLEELKDLERRRLAELAKIHAEAAR